MILLITCTVPIPEMRAMNLNRPWTGDLDGMLETGFIRALVPYNKTHFFIDKGRMHGATYESLMQFEKVINSKYAPRKQSIKILFIPVYRDEIIPALLEGRGDIAAAGLTITPTRKKRINFTDPVAQGVDEIVVCAKGTPDLARLEDLAGKQIYVRKSSSYYESLRRLNTFLEKNGKPPVTIKHVPEYLEDEEILEMVNARLIPMTVVDTYLVTLWSNIFKAMVSHPDISVNRDGDIAWMIRKNSPKLKQELNDYIKGHKQGSLFGNVIINRYLKSSKWIHNSLQEKDLKRFHETVALFRKYAVDGCTGSDEYNMGPSRKRAIAVVEYLTRQNGIDQARLVPQWYGKLNPKADNATDNGRSLNRSAEISVGGI